MREGDGVKIVFVGDVHLADKPPSTRRESYPLDVLTKLAEVGVVAGEVGACAVVYSGDIFHSKVPARTSHALVARAVQVFRAQGLPQLVVPGNHDYAGANPAELERAPLRVVALSEAVTLFGLPEARALSFDGVTFSGVREEEPIEAFRLEEGSADVVVAHSPIFPEGEEPPFPFFPAREVAALLPSSVRLCLYGHIHDPHGVYQESGVTFVNPGSLSRGSLWESNPQRIPQVAVVDVKSLEVEFVPLSSARPWSEVFRVAEEYEKRDRSLAAADFAAELVAAQIDVFDVERVVAQLRAREDVSRRVVDRAVELVEAVSL